MSSQGVAFLASEYPPYVYGGLGTHVHALTSALADRGMGIVLFVPSRTGGYEPSPHGVELLSVPISNPRSDMELWLQFGHCAIAAAKKLGNSIAVVHCHDWMTILAGIHLRRILDVPLVFSVHLPQKTSPYLSMENLGLVCADYVLVSSRAVARELAGRGLPIKSLRMIPNGVDLDRFVPSSSSSADRYILFVGRLTMQKGVDIALRAFSVLLRLCPDVRLIVVGDGDLALYYQRVARYLGLSSQVSFVGWKTDQSLVKLYQEATIVVMPSFYEPFGMVALEAMACGRPVVVTRTGGLVEIVEDGVNGYLVPPGDYLQLAQRIATLLLNPNRATRFGEAAHLRAMSFGWEKIAACTERLYAKVIDEGAILPLGEPSGIVDEFIKSVDPTLLPLTEQLVTDI
jgi:glycosyltransferase involved in cell wall biosynthesis